MAYLNEVMTDANGRPVSTQRDVREITPGDLAGANAGQRPDLIAFTDVFYKLSTTGAIYVSNGTALVLAAGTSRVQTPYVLAQSAIPVILPSNGTIDAAGVVTLVTALPRIIPDAWCYFPAGAVVGGLAGLYFVKFSSTTVGQVFAVYNDVSAEFFAEIPTEPYAAAVGSNSAYTQTTGTNVAITRIKVSGGLLGVSGALLWNSMIENNNSGNTKSQRADYGAFQILGSGTSTNIASSTLKFMYNISAARQMAQSLGAISFQQSAGVVIGTVDSTVDQDFVHFLSIANATDFMLSSARGLLVVPNP